MVTPPPVRALILAVDDDPAVGRAIERDYWNIALIEPQERASAGLFQA